MNLSIVIPAYLAGRRILKTLKRISHYCRKETLTYEILVIDDASPDDTYEKAFAFAQRDPSLQVLQNDDNYGKGYSVRKGMLKARGEYLLFTDADMPVSIQHIQTFIQDLQNGFDLVIASKWLPGSKSRMRQGFLRRLAGRIFNLLGRLILNLPYRDTQCGFKFFRKEAAAKIFEKQKLQGFSFDTEILFLAQKWGLRVREAPVKWRDNERESTVQVMKHALGMFLDLFRIRLYDVLGYYE